MADPEVSGRAVRFIFFRSSKRISLSITPDICQNINSPFYNKFIYLQAEI